jgi:hypothetical protein
MMCSYHMGIPSDIGGIMTFKIPEDLPDQNKRSKGEKFAAGAKLRSELHAAVTKAARLAEKEFISSNPDAAKLRYVHQGHAYENKPGFGSVVPKIVDYMVILGRAKLTQKAILDEVRKNLPNQVIQNNIWSMPLKRSVLNKAQERITGNMTRPISVDGCKTLSDIKKKLRASLTVKNAVFTAKVTIAIDADNVVIGKNVYPIQKRQAGKGKYEYPSIRIGTGNKRQWVRVDLLREALE